MKILLLILIILCIASCKISSEERRALDKKTGILRKDIFVECMKLVADINKATAQHYNDLDDVVVECSNQARYMANHING